MLVGQRALASIQWIDAVDEQLAVRCGYQQPRKLLDPENECMPSQTVYSLQL